jgi:hypothetical protein
MLRIVVGWPMAAEICAASAARTVSVARIERAQKNAAALNRTSSATTAMAAFLIMASLLPLIFTYRPLLSLTVAG